MKKAGATSVATAALVVAGLLSTNDVLAIQPPSPTVAGIEIVPSGGGGFGGLGVSPFGWGPFGGFGMVILRCYEVLHVSLTHHALMFMYY